MLHLSRIAKNWVEDAVTCQKKTHTHAEFEDMKNLLSTNYFFINYLQNAQHWFLI